LDDVDAIAQALIRLIFAESHSFDTEREHSRSDRWQEPYAAFLTDFACKGSSPSAPIISTRARARHRRDRLPRPRF